MKNSKVYLIIISVLCLSIFNYIMNYSMKKDFQLIANESLKSTHSAYLSIFDTYKISAKKDYDYLMKNKEVLKLLKKFKYATNEEQKVIRGLLYRKVFEQYLYSKKLGIRQYHFHTHEGKSLLRLHNLPKNQDSILQLRTSIKKANIQIDSSFGFEGGRVFPGFRYVFPIVYEKEHLGSVEFSLAFEAFEERLKTVLPAHAYVLLVNKETSIDKVFDVYKEYFHKSSLVDNFYIESPKISKISKRIQDDQIIQDINKLLRHNEEFKNNINKAEEFSIPLILNEKAFIISFLAIYNTDNQFSSYIISYKEQKDLVSIKSKYLTFIVIGSVLIFLLIYLLIFAFNQRANTLKQKLKIEKNHKDLQTILDYQNNIIVLHEKGKIKQVNKAFLEFFQVSGISEFNSRKKELSKIYNFDLDNKTFNIENFEKDLEGKKLNHIKNKTIKMINKKDSSENIFLLNIDEYHDDGYVIVLTNINELVELQNIVSTQSKVAAIGEMIGNIAHQWRQPLSAISTDISGLKLQIEYLGNVDKNEVVNCIDRVNEHTLYLSKTIDDFRYFFKDDSNKRSEFNLKELIERALTLSKDSLKSNDIKTINDLNNIYIHQNESIFLQALLNIINNSKDALAENQEDSKYIFIKTSKIDTNTEIVIYDNAGGIDDGIINKVFEPYFTTKHQSIGTGIGLYMTHQIITKQLNGTIKVKNINFEYKKKNYIGAQFKITIPIENRS